MFMKLLLYYEYDLIYSLCVCVFVLVSNLSLYFYYIIKSTFSCYYVLTLRKHFLSLFRNIEKHLKK